VFDRELGVRARSREKSRRLPFDARSFDDLGEREVFRAERDGEVVRADEENVHAIDRCDLARVVDGAGRLDLDDAKELAFLAERSPPGTAVHVSDAAIAARRVTVV
jgi:hypothetical protein